MMTGAVRPAADEITRATNAAAIRPRSWIMSGPRRLRAVPRVAPGSWLCSLFSAYGLVVMGASLGVIELDVLRTRVEQVLVRADGEHFAFHQQHDLVVVLDRRDLLRDRDQRDAGVVA